MNEQITKSVIEEFAGTVTETGFMALAAALGLSLPATLISVPLAKGLVVGLLENCFNDCSQMTLSVNEKKKLNQVSSVALQTFWELAEKDGVKAWEMCIDPAYIDYSYEVAEHATLEAIRQSEKKKIDILGRYYGRKFYKGGHDWQDMHQMITMAGSLTLRQLVMIRLISEGFPGIDEKLYISNPSACVEINRLKEYGIWQTSGAAFGINESDSIRIDRLVPTKYSEQVNEELMLDKLSENDVKRVIDSLRLTAEGISHSELTEDDFNRKTNYSVDGHSLILPR